MAGMTREAKAPIRLIPPMITSPTTTAETPPVSQVGSPKSERKLAAMVKACTALPEPKEEITAQQAKKMASDPLGGLGDGVGVVDAAAWTLVANALLNLDEMFLKP